MRWSLIESSYLWKILTMNPLFRPDGVAALENLSSTIFCVHICGDYGSLEFSSYTPSNRNQRFENILYGFKIQFGDDRDHWIFPGPLLSAVINVSKIDSTVLRGGRKEWPN